MIRKFSFILIGTLLLLIWVLSFGELTIKLISQILNNKQYYFDNTFLYFFAFALAPFVLNSYIDGVHLDEVMSQKRKILHKVNLVLLSFFALMLFSLSIATYYAFYDSFFNEKISVQFLILVIPIIISVCWIGVIPIIVIIITIKLIRIPIKIPTIGIVIIIHKIVSIKW